MGAIELAQSSLRTASAPNLMAYYRFESNGTDSSTNTNNLTGVNTPTYVAGMFANGTDLELSSSQYFTAPDNSSLDTTTNISVSAWIKPESLSTNHTIVCKGRANGDANTRYNFRVTSVGKLNFSYASTGPAFHEWLSTAAPIVAGSWYHVVLTYTYGTASSLKVYVNGQLYTGSWIGGTGASAVLAETDVLQVGCIHSVSGAEEFFDGIIDDLSLWNIILSAEDVKELYEGRCPGELWPTYSSSLKALYHLSGITDSSGNGFNLTNTNAVTFSDGKFNNGANLGPTNTNKELQVLNDLGIEGTSITISLWVKLNTEIGSGTYGIAGQSGATSFVYNYIWYEYNSGTRRLAFVRLKNGVGTNAFYHNVALGTSEYHHIVYTFDTATVKGYLDGTLVTSGASSGSGSSGGSDGFEIGRDYSGNFGSFMADECFVLNSAWSDTEIKNYYAWAKGQRTSTA